MREQSIHSSSARGKRFRNSGGQYHWPFRGSGGGSRFSGSVGRFIIIHKFALISRRDLSTSLQGRMNDNCLVRTEPCQPASKAGYALPASIHF